MKAFFIKPFEAPQRSAKIKFQLIFYLLPTLGREGLINRSEYDGNLTIEWFDCNYIKLNEDKCHLIISGHKSEEIWAKIGQKKYMGK